MTKYVPSVSVELLIKADRKVAEDHEDGLPPDPMVSIVSALHGECEPDEMIAISHRLMALARIIESGGGKGWTIKVDGEEYTLVNEALIRAAATARLPEAKTVGELKFDPKEILDITLHDADALGSA